MANTNHQSLLYITDSIGFGGAEKYLVDVMDHFKQSSQVKLLLLGQGSPELERRIRDLNIEVLKFNQPSLSLLPKLVKFLWSYRNWQWHVNLTHYDSCRHVQFVAVVLPKTRVVATLHTLADIDPKSGWRIIMRLMRQKVYERFNAVIAPSQYIANKLVFERNFSQAKVRVIYNGVKIESSSKSSSIKIGSPPVILIVARLHPDKGHKYLFEALAKLIHDGVNFICQVVGEGPLQDELQLQVMQLGLTSRVQFLGFRNDIPKLLKSARVLALPSLPESENFPLVVLEAMAAGVPVIATKVGGVPEQVIDSKTGMLVEPRDVLALAEAIKELVKDPKLSAQMGAAGEQRYQDLFTLDRMMEGLTKLYVDCA